MSGRPPAVRGQRRFEALLQGGVRAKNGPVTVHFLPLAGTDGAVRVAYSISRKVGGAVVRNTCRRRLRAIVGEISGELPAGEYLIGVRPDIRVLAFGELRERVIETMRRASKSPR